jgi:hypothetical protein
MFGWLFGKREKKTPEPKTDAASPRLTFPDHPLNPDRVGRPPHWITERATITTDLGCIVSYRDAWDDYQAWCQREGLQAMSRGKFLRLAAARVGTSPGRKVFLGLVLKARGERARFVA